MSFYVGRYSSSITETLYSYREPQSINEKTPTQEDPNPRESTQKPTVKFGQKEFSQCLDGFSQSKSFAELIELSKDFKDRSSVQARLIGILLELSLEGANEKDFLNYLNSQRLEVLSSFSKLSPAQKALVDSKLLEELKSSQNVAKTFQKAEFAPYRASFSPELIDFVINSPEIAAYEKENFIGQQLTLWMHEKKDHSQLFKYSKQVKVYDKYVNSLIYESPQLAIDTLKREEIAKEVIMSDQLNSVLAKTAEESLESTLMILDSNSEFFEKNLLSFDGTLYWASSKLATYPNEELINFFEKISNPKVKNELLGHVGQHVEAQFPQKYANFKNYFLKNFALDPESRAAVCAGSLSSACAIDTSRAPSSDD